MIRLADLKIKLDEGKRKKITDEYGLTLLLIGRQSTTTYQFVIRYSENGKQKQITLKTKNLQEAREIAYTRYKHTVCNTTDDVLTFGDVINDFVQIQQNKVSDSTLTKLVKAVGKHLKPHFNENISKCNAKWLYTNIYENVIKESHIETVKYLTNILKRAYRVAAVNYNCVIPNIEGIDIILPKPQNNHLPALTDGNITENIQEISMCVQCSSNLKLRLLFKLSMHLLLRQQEVCSIELDNIDYENKLLFIPQTKTLKNGFTVPLTKQVLEIIKECKKLKVHSDNKYLLESRVHKFEYISTSTLNVHFKRNGLKGEQTAHGLRAIGRTWLEQQGIKFEVAEACLSHFVGNSTVKAYRRTDYLEERKEVMQTWSDYLDTVL